MGGAREKVSFRCRALDCWSDPCDGFGDYYDFFDGARTHFAFSTRCTAPEIPPSNPSFLRSPAMPLAHGCDTTALEHQLGSCSEYLRHLKDEAAECRRQHRKLQSGQAHRRQHILDVAFVLYVIRETAEQTALAYIERRPSEVLQMDTQQVLEYLENRFLETDCEVLSNISDGFEVSISKSAMREAHRFGREEVVYNWIQKQNVEHGLAPPSHFVVQFRRANLQSLSPETTSVTSKNAKAGELKWVQRFRRRWGLRLGRVPVGEVVPVEKLRAKVICWETKP